MTDTPAVVQDDAADSDVDELTAALAAGKSDEGVVEEDTSSDTDPDSNVDADKETPAPEAPETVTITKTEYEGLRAQTADLRTVTLQQKRQLATLESRVARLTGTKPKEEEGLDLLGDDVPEEKKPTETEALENSLNKIRNERAGLFEVMVDVMQDSNKYSDVLEVVSDAHVSDMVNAVASHLSQEEGIDYHTAALKAENHIWSQPNPYKYLYGLIKEYHPTYVAANAAQDKDATKAEQKTGEKTPDGKSTKPVKAPGSVADLPGAHSGKATGWTAERIDKMPEEDLHKVPADIYEKYMAGELD